MGIRKTYKISRKNKYKISEESQKHFLHCVGSKTPSGMYVKSPRYIDRQELEQIIQTISDEYNSNYNDGDLILYSDETFFSEMRVKQAFIQLQDMLKKDIIENFGQDEYEQWIKDEEPRNENSEKFATKTPMLDKYAPTVFRVLGEMPLVKRSYKKSMMTAPDDLAGEQQITTRGVHIDQVADGAAEVAEYIGANSNLSRLGGKIHDLGHVSNAHEGERTSDAIARLFNVGYTHHSTLSVDKLLKGGFLERVKEAIQKDRRFKPEDWPKLEEELWIAFDIALSHCGELSAEELEKSKPNRDKTTDQIKKDRDLSYSVKGHIKKIVPKTLEACIVRIEDVVSYIRTDINDGFTLKIINRFDNEYLKAIGAFAILGEENKKLYNLQNSVIVKKKALKAAIESGMYQLQHGENIPPDKKEALIATLRENIDKLNQVNKMKDRIAELNLIYGEQYVKSIPKYERKRKIPDLVRDVLQKDLIEFSVGKEYIGLSPMAFEAFSQLRNQNLRQIVMYTKREMDRKTLPEIKYNVVCGLKQALKDTGILQSYLGIKYTKEDYERFMKARKRIGVKTFEEQQQEDEEINEYEPAKDKSVKPEEYERRVCRHFLKLYRLNPRLVEELYQNAYNSVPARINDKVDIALLYLKRETLQARAKNGENVQEELAQIVEKIEKEKNSYLFDKLEPEILQLKEEIMNTYPDGMSDEQRQEFVEKHVDAIREDEEDLLAGALAVDYFNGMTDSTVLHAARMKGLIDEEVLAEEKKRGTYIDSALQKMEVNWKKEENKDKVFVQKALNFLNSLTQPEKPEQPQKNGEEGR